MVNPQPSQSQQDLPNTAPQTGTSLDQTPTPLRCITGALISGAIAFGLYLLTTSIHQTFADTPIPNTSILAMRLSNLVRTLVIGVGSLGTITFGVTTLGLLGLSIQLLLGKSPQE